MDPNSYFYNTAYDDTFPITPLEPYFQAEQITNIHPFQISTPTFNEELILSTLTPNSIFKDTNYLGFDDTINDFSGHEDTIFNSNDSEDNSKYSDHEEEEDDSKSRFSDLLSPIQSPLLKPKKSSSSSAAACECTNCGTTNTPLWRRNPEGEPLCNACGLFLKLHGKVRPLSLKTDVIKKRNRTSTTHRASKKKRKSHLKRK